MAAIYLGDYPDTLKPRPTTDVELIAALRLFNHHTAANRLEELTLRTACVCNIGVQECHMHPGRLRTKDDKIAFRKWWDALVREP